MKAQPTVIVTGAGSGIGRSTAIAFARESYRVALVGRTERKLLETRDVMLQAVADAPETLIVPADLADAAQAAAVIDAVVGRWGRIDVLVNNAGVGRVAPIEQSTPEFIASIFADNAFSAATLVWRAWPTLIRQRSACIVMVSSMAAHDPFPGFFGYAATKAAMESFARSIVNDARSGGHPGVRAFSVAPGAVETPMLRSAFSKEVLPASRTLDPERIAATIVDAVLGRIEVENGGAIKLPSP
jgi:NAD(P)-dependent dehydrogenase (short-subunit alcohol dehydrogenase family)